MLPTRRAFVRQAAAAGGLLALAGPGSASALPTTDFANAMPAALPPFTVSQITTTPWSLAQDLRTYPQLGVGIELWEKKFEARRLPRQLEELRATGLSISSVQPEVLSIFPNHGGQGPKAPAERLEKLKQTIRRFAPVAQGRPFVTNTGALPGGNEAEVWRTCVRHYQELARFAADQGVRLALEALGPSLMNRSSILYQVPQVLEMVAEVNHPSFGICVDFYNNWQDTQLPEHLRACADRLWLVHLADWQRPRSFHDRRPLGDGHIPTARLLQACREVGYAGPFVLEIFSENVPDSLWQGDLAGVITQSKTAFEQAWRG